MSYRFADSLLIPKPTNARVSKSVPAVNMWPAHTTNPNNPIAIMAKIIPKFPNASFFLPSWQMMWGIMPNLGRMRMWTSGFARNQNRRWYRIDYSPPAGSKNDIFRLLSVSSIHSLVFSLRGRVGRNQSPVMWPVWLWHTASWASSWG